MQTVISIITSLVLLLASTGILPGGRALPEEDEAAAAAVILPEEPAESGPSVPEGLEYEHCDPAQFYRDTGRLTELAAGRDSTAVLALYDELYAQLEHADTMSAVAYIRSCADLTDEHWMEESAYSDTLLTGMTDALSSACRAVLEGPCARAFAAHIGQAAAAELRDYAPMTDREAELTARETELVDTYNALMNEADTVTYSYLGETWDWEMISGFPGTSLAYRDYDGYLEVYYGLQKALNDQVGPVFTELVQLRAELADIAGYDSYADMAYEEVFGRDYGPEQAQALCEAVRDIGPAYYEELFYSDLWYDYDTVWPVLGRDELLETLGKYAGELDPSLEGAWRDMTEEGLCAITDGEDSFPGSFTLPLSERGSAFIFSRLQGDCSDLSTLAHEFGHFAYDRRHPTPDLLTSVASYDLLEIHSTGLEVLLSSRYDEIYTDGADTARFLVLGDLMEAVLDGCIYDEFQRRGYARPDMSLDEMNRLFAAICSTYGLEEPLNVDYSWMYVSHTFESPLYYISYAASALAAIQIWELAQEDLRSATDAWLAVMDADVYAESYQTVLPACGLRLFTEPGAVEDICRPLLAELERLSAGT